MTENEDIIKQISRIAYKKVQLYMYYKGDDKEIYKFLKEFQIVCDGKGVGSQVIIVTEDRVETGLNNLYITKDEPKCFTDRVLDPETHIAINFKKMPLCNARDFYTFIKTMSYYDDEYIELKQI